MEMKQKRVLAYEMAKVIEHSDLVDVGGGTHWTNRETIKPSGDGHSWDVTIDVAIDF